MFTRRVALGLAGASVGALGLGLGLRTATHARAEKTPFPNVPLMTHEGRSVRFYDDLVRGKVVALNMMYVRCKGICPRMTSNLIQVQELLGDRLGRDVFMVSISLEPEADTPGELRKYIERHPTAPRWTFVTGSVADVERVRLSLGFYDTDPAVDADRAQHTGALRIGNDPLGRWTMTPALGRPDQIAASLLRIRGEALPPA